MNGRMHAEAKATSKLSFVPVRTGLLAGYRGKQLVSQPPLFQAKLTINQPNDRYEQEADRVAEQVMWMPEEEELIQTKPLAERITPLDQRQVEEEEEEIQTEEKQGNTPEVTHDLESRIHALKVCGQPLSETTRAYFEPRFGYDFSGVREHTDADADRLNRALNARAFIIGRDIFFRQGEYNSGSSSGRELLAHELTHVVQQGEMSAPPLQRLIAVEKAEDLKSEKYAGNPRLERAYDNEPPMRIGESGEGVRLVQEGLVMDGFPMPRSTKPTGEMDGIFGPETFSVIRKFQAKHELAMDGVVGRETMGKLDNLAAKGGTLPTCSFPEEDEVVNKSDFESFGEQDLHGIQQTNGDLPDIEITPGDSKACTPLSKKKSKKQKPKKPVKIKPKNPKQPQDLRNYKCENKQLLKIEVFTCMLSKLISDQILKARLLLLNHNMDLQVTVKPISPPIFPLGCDIKLPENQGGDGEIQHHIQLCELIGKTIKDVGHDAGTLPVFFLPVGPFIMMNISPDGEAAAFFTSSPDSSICALGGGKTGMDKVVVMNLRGILCDTTLLHEIGHAARNPHFDNSFMHNPGCNKNRHVIFHHQVRKLCNTSFR